MNRKFAALTVYCQQYFSMSLIVHLNILLIAALAAKIVRASEVKASGADLTPFNLQLRLDHLLVPIHKWPIFPISALREKFNPQL